MLGAVVFGHQQQQAVIDLIHSLVEEGGKPVWDWQAPAKDEALIAKVTAAAEADLRAAYQMRQKQARQQRLKEIYKNATAECVPADASADHARAVGNHAVRPRSEDRPPADPGAASRASTAATRAPCARSPSAPACCRAPTARRCSRAARRRRWWSARSAPRATSRSSTR